MNILDRAKAIECELMELVWKAGDPEDEGEDREAGESKKGPGVVPMVVDMESGKVQEESRPTHIMNSVLVGFTLMIVTSMLGAGAREIAVEMMVDSGFQRLAFLALTPVQIFFTLVRLVLAFSFFAFARICADDG